MCRPPEAGSKTSTTNGPVSNKSHVLLRPRPAIWVRFGTGDRGASDHFLSPISIGFPDYITYCPESQSTGFAVRGIPSADSPRHAIC
jgi:hypothetical protein